MKDEITITKAELAIALQKASTTVANKMQAKSNKPEIILVSNLFGVMFTAQVLADLFNDDSDPKTPEEILGL